MTSIPANVASNLAQRLVDRAINEAHYLCCFKSYVEDFEKEKERLSATREGVRKDIEEARQRNENRIDDETQQWLNEADSLIQEDTKAKKKWVFGLCTNCIWQYGRGKELAGKTLEIPKLMERRNNLVRVARSAGPVGMEYHSVSNFIHFESRKAKFEELKEALKNNDNHIIGLQGMGGTGKTTMATQVGKEVEESKLFDKVIFTIVSNPPDVKKIRDDIARHLGLTLEEGKEQEHPEKLWSRIANGEEKILIILDDVWDKELNLKALGIPPGRHRKGSCSVLLTTRDMSVCEEMGCQRTIELGVLSCEDALKLLLFHAGKSVNDSSHDVKDVALDIVKECGRLPVAITAVARTLKNWSLIEWKAALTTLQNSKPMHNVHENLKKVYKSLSLSYDNLENEDAKKLFLLCSLFPEDFEISIELFSRIAIGLGICGEVDKYYIARSQVPAIKHILIDSCLLLKAEKECVRMHDLVREVALWIANEEIQVVMNSKTTFMENIKYSSWNIDDFSNHFDGRKLEFLLVRTKGNCSMKSLYELFEDMVRLRVLILICTYWKSQTLSLPQLTHSLRNIRTLILDEWELGDISTLINLQSLETLELTRCLIIELPNEVQALEKLRLLSLKNCIIKRSNPFRVIEGSPQLEELYYVGNSHEIDIENKDEEFHHFGTCPDWQRYHISLGYGYPAEVDASVSRCFKPGSLKEIFSEATFKFLAARAEVLSLGEYHGTGWTNLIPDIFPMKDGGLKDLIRLFLYSWFEIECLINTKKLQSGVTIFSKLVELQLYRMDVKELCCGPLPIDFLKQLETLELDTCLKLESTLFKGKLDLVNLKSIKLESCSITSLFHLSTARSLKRLETLEICECDQLKYIITNEGSEDEEKVDHHDLNQKEKEKEIIFPSLKKMDISKVPKFINFLECQCYHPQSSAMQNSSLTTRDDLKVKDPNPSHTFSWAHICCFKPKSSATSIDNPYVSEATLPNCTSSQELKTEVIFYTSQCLLRPPLNPRNMREMTITHCSNLTSLFTFSIASSMLLLEELEIKKCHGLKHIVTGEGDGHDHMKYTSIFPNLKQVSVKNCRILETLFPASHCRINDHLKLVLISKCQKLRYVFGKCHCEEYLAHQNHNVEIRLPSLEGLSIQDAPNMINICIENYHLTALSLKGIILGECPQLPVRPLFSFTVDLQERQEDLTKRKAMEMKPEKLIGLYLNNVDIDTIYDLERPQIKGPMKSMLETVWLKNLPELRYICLGLKNNLSLQNLSELKILGCKKLEVIFSASILRSLPKLEEIFVSECKELVQIIEETEENYDLLHQLCFPELSNIHVKKCESLKCLFSFSTCGMLPNLKELKIEEAPKLVQVFGNKQGQTKEMVTEDEFPKLQTLVLKNLPSLDSVCQGIDFQTVPSIFVRDCPKISLTSTVKRSFDDDDEDDFKLSSSETSSEDEESLEDQDDEVKAASSDEAASQSKKESMKKFVDEDLEIQEQNNNTLNLTEGTIAETYNFPTISLSLSTTKDEEDEDSEELDQEMVGSNENPPPNTNSQLQKRDMPPSQLSANQTQSDLTESKKEETKKIVKKDLGIQEQNNNTPNLTENTKEAGNEVVKQGPGSDIPEMVASSSISDMSREIHHQKTPSLVIKETINSSVQEGPKLEKTIVANEIMELEPSNASSDPFVLQNESPQDTLVGKEAEDETIIMEQHNIEVSVGEGPSSEKYNKPTSSSHCSTTTFKELDETAQRVDKPLNNTQEVEEPTNECSSEERSNITALAIPPTLVEMKDSISSISSSMKPQTVSATSDPESGVSQSNQADISRNSEFPQLQNKIVVNQTEIDNPKQFEEDDLIRLFQIMEEGADVMEVHMPHVSKIASVEDDNKVGEAFADLEVSLKMVLNEIASSEENSLRLQNALNLLSTHFSEDGPPSHGLSATIDSLHQEFQSILCSFKQASSTVHAFTKLEEKEKCMINEELPRRKQEARTLVSEIFKTEKSKVEAQQKEAELKEQISRLQAEMKSKEKEIKDCEMKLLSLQEQKKKSVSETMRFMKDFEDVKKDKSQMMEEEIKARQELEKVDAKWSSYVGNLRKTTLLLGIHLNQNL